MFQTRWGLVVQVAVITILAIGLYLRCVPGPFIWDDRLLIAQIENQNTVDLVTGSFLINPTGAGGDFYRPVTTLSLLLDYTLWGDNPLFFHLTNLLLHALGALSVFLLTRRLFPPVVAFVASCFFAAHPAHCEPVCWISGRADLLYSIFLILAIWGYLKWRGSRLVYLCLVPAVLSLLSKETAVVLVGLAPLCLWLDGERRIRALAQPAYLFGGLCVVYFAIRALYLPSIYTVSPPANLLEHFSLIVYSTFMHYKILLLPHAARLGYEVVTDEIVGITMIECAVPLAALACFAIARRKDWPSGFFAVAWVAIALIPASNIVRGATHTVVAQRYTYLASLGLAVFLALLVTARSYRVGRVAAAAAILIYFGVISVSHSGLWRHDVVFWRQFVSDVPAMGWGYYNLGISYSERKQWSRALDAYTAATMLMPKEALPVYGKGELFLARGEYAKAVECFEQAVQLAPDDPYYQSKLDNALSAN